MNGVDSQIDNFSSWHPRTVAQALAEGAELLSYSGVESPRLDAELLLCEALGVKRERLYVNYESALARQSGSNYASLLKRRREREPMAYILGHREFWSLDFRVTPDVLVPRPETEVVVEEALDQLANLEKVLKPSRPKPGFRILDLGTGSGAIAVSLAKERNDLEIWATDLSSAALEVARFNAQKHGIQEQIQFCRGDLFEPVARQKGFFHLIVSNPPYVNQQEMSDLSREVGWEPRLALDGGQDGLDFYRRIISQAHRYLVEGGVVTM
ncbi:MAG: peptide chain release factor N(5)-glutamine methyltransferase, partial [Deltaproteobacteria bacterium]|nr:peptide chain release factor N(5)-glutamine methyltransferase [Deltaproteobacteria bacterium]